MIPVIPILIAGGIIGWLVLSRDNKTGPTPNPNPNVPPGPSPLPPPPVPPIQPPANVTQALISQATELLLNAGTNPDGANPEQMDALATRLDPIRPDIAQALRNTAQLIRIRQQGPVLQQTFRQTATSGANRFMQNAAAYQYPSRQAAIAASNAYARAWSSPLRRR